MPIINKTLEDSTISLATLNAKVLGLETKIDGVSGEQLNKAIIYENETDRDTNNTAPTNEDWCYVTSSENASYLGQVVLYKYTDSWNVVTAINFISDATTTSKGIVQLNGDLTGTASSPQLKSITTGGTYAFGNNTATVDSKGRLINVISGTTSYEWTFHSRPNQRSSNTHVLTLPSYDIANATLMFFYNGLLIPEQDNFIRTNSTTITTNFLIDSEDDILIMNIKFIGKIDSSAIINDSVIDTTITYSSSKLESDFASLSKNIIPSIPNFNTIGSAANSYKDGYFHNSPIITSARSKKRDIVNNELALEFTNSLISRQYKMFDGVRNHLGFVADEIKSSLDLFGVDFGVYIKDEKGNEALRYEELIPILCSAIQELTPWYKKLYYRIKKYFRRKKVVVNE